MSVDPLSTIEVPASPQCSVSWLELYSEVKKVLHCYDTLVDLICHNSRNTSFGIRHGFESYQIFVAESLLMCHISTPVKQGW